MTQGLALAKLHACREIDLAAGEARSRYITDVPGQQAVYMRKKEQAQAYLAALQLDHEAPVPPYIAAEAAALEQTAEAVATTVLTLAALWEDTLSPQIEAARLAGKAAVQAATTAADAAAARDAARAALAEL